ncbi:MAG: LPS export ABC transporter periplasmic protein LptC [Bacteroidetes bacterium]|nr:MAG: LPS export ABC transporter periplasmic protein LptC [Bacteroidota bacterium]
MKLRKKIKKSIVLLSILVVTMLSSCSDDIPKINRIASKGDIPTIAIDGFKATFTENGLTKGKLKAKRLEQYDDVVEPNTKFPKGISIVFFDESGAIESSMTAKFAIFYNKKETWEAIGNVVFSNINGDVLKTEHLYGDEKQQKIYTDEFVQITSSNGGVIKGASGFESNSEFTIYKFIDVSGRIAIQDEFGSDADTTSQSLAPVKKSNELKKKTAPRPIPKKLKDGVKLK